MNLIKLFSIYPELNKMGVETEAKLSMAVSILELDLDNISVYHKGKERLIQQDKGEELLHIFELNSNNVLKPFKVCIEDKIITIYLNMIKVESLKLLFDSMRIEGHVSNKNGNVLSKNSLQLNNNLFLEDFINEQGVRLIKITIY